ncbi:MAG: protease [Clostridiales bacterium]|nr:protease [Clostridiales bacterium]
MFELVDYERLLQNLPSEIKEAEVNAELHTKFSVGVSEGKVISTEASSLTEIFVRASGESTGYAYTQSLEEPARDVILRGYENGSCSNTGKRDIINTRDRAYSGNGPEDSSNENMETLRDTAVALENEILRSESDVAKATVKISAATVGMHVLNSKGVKVSYSYPVYEAETVVMAQRGRKEYNASCLTTSTAIDGLDKGFIVNRIKESLENQYDIRSFQSGYYSAVLSSRVVVNIMTTLWQLFSGVKYMEGSSALCGRLGEKIGADVLNISDTPVHPKTGYIYPFDCEGSRGKDQKLVSGGRLEGLMHNLKTSWELGVEATGNAGRRALLSGAVSTDILVIPKNIYIEPGEKNLDELLQNMEEGIYITDSYDIFHSINIGSGDFNIPCRGVMIKKGRKEYAVTALNICGNILDLFNNIEEIGKDINLEPIIMLKSYCIGGPSIRLKKLQVNGK